MSAHRLPATNPATAPASSTAAARTRFWPQARAWRQILIHLLIPLVMGAGMALAYMGAFHSPDPHNVPLAVVGEGPETKVFAQSLNDAADGKLKITTLPSADVARQQIRDQKIYAAYVPEKDHASILVSSAASEAASGAAQKVFLPLAYKQHLPVTIDDVRPGGTNDPTGQSLFFLLVALSVGSYASVVALAASTAKLRVGMRLVIAAVVALVVSGIGTLVAGPIYQVLNGYEWNIWMLGALYSFGIIAIGLGLHAMLGKWTTPALTLLFVMLNFTSSGGIYPAELSPAFFAGLNSFWNGAAWLNAVRDLTYFPGADFGVEGLKLTLWAAAGVALILLTHLASVKKRQLADDTMAVTAEEESSVVVAG